MKKRPRVRKMRRRKTFLKERKTLMKKAKVKEKATTTVTFIRQLVSERFNLRVLFCLFFFR